ncbi:polysaccharide biosynthesis protein [Anaerocolumna sp. AGMB13020]|uniref:putative polysaccharide biosynthesis protein n=1 Tax=Anaerocolumna sp. AGMB13020 TaxID=3081750 RepID=UPI002954B119|nr:polysaccharide biosynthesis protein [Anaerocolumna sp. AGMB13020]WOO36812.1 polysaccharide biosynthesis protein [Anaerocolumna sp. AGMB13020]
MRHGNNRFVKQAMFLSITGILVKIIGVAYGVPLTNIIGDLGNTYYSSAYYVYSIILLICSYSIPMGLSKIMSERIAIGQHRTASRVFLCALLYVCLVGGGASLLTFFFADRIVDFKQSIITMKILAPTIFLSGILSVFRGYYQAKGTMLPTAISQLLEQLVNAAASIWFAITWTRLSLLKGSKTGIAEYGAAGGAAGTGAGVAVALIFILILFYVNRRKHKLKSYVVSDTAALSYKETFKLIFALLTPVILSTCLYNFVGIFDMKLYFKTVQIKSIDITADASLYGIFSRKYSPLANVPIAIAASMSATLVPVISTAFAKKEFQIVKSRIYSGMKYSMLFVIPAAFGLGALAEPILNLLFPNSDILAVHLLQIGSISIILYGMSTILNGVLQGIGKVNVPLMNSGAALLIHMAVLVPLLLFTELKIYAIIATIILYSLIICILNLIAVYRVLGYIQEIKQTFCIPILSAIIMSLAAMISYRLTDKLFSSTLLSPRISCGIGVILSVAVGAFVYFFTVLNLGNYEAELKRFPIFQLIILKKKRSNQKAA